MKKSRIVSAVILLFFGAAFIAVGIFFQGQTQKFIEDGVATQATIVRIDYDSYTDEEAYRVYVEFSVNGRTYSGLLNVYTSGMHEGQTVPIYYSQDNPNKFIYARAPYLFNVLFYILGGILFALGAAIILYNLIRGTKTTRLKKHGYTVHAKIVSIALPMRVRANVLGKHLAELTCTDDQGQIYTESFFTSKEEQFPHGAEIDIYVDREDPEKYKIDIRSFLAEQKSK